MANLADNGLILAPFLACQFVTINLVVGRGKYLFVISLIIQPVQFLVDRIVGFPCSITGDKHGVQNAFAK